MSQLTGFTLLQEDVGMFIQYKGIEFLACVDFEGAKFNIYGRTVKSVNLSDLPSLLEFWYLRLEVVPTYKSDTYAHKSISRTNLKRKNIGKRQVLEEALHACELRHVYLFSII